MFSTERAHTCALMGHHDAPECIYPDIVRAIAHAYDSGEAHTFRVGDRGAFCVMAARALSEVASTRPDMDWSVVMSHMPKQDQATIADWQHTLFPDEFTRIPPQFAMVRRDAWLLEHAGMLIVYAPHTGNSQRAALRARSMKLRVVEL